ncbi:hypothetical protein O3P69_004353 [Scylla paramamosain]|uniref:Uncharacterized protein n=1 Tax=Scylla paramamosain TaxID=85552 RepID=A0AAW0UCV3_SCYPA
MWRPKDEPLRAYRANQHGLLLETGMGQLGDRLLWRRVVPQSVSLVAGLTEAVTRLEDRVSAVELNDGHAQQALRDLVNVKTEYGGEEEAEGSEWDGRSITTGLGDELATAGQVAQPSVGQSGGSAYSLPLLPRPVPQPTSPSVFPVPSPYTPPPPSSHGYRSSIVRQSAGGQDSGYGKQQLAGEGGPQPVGATQACLLIRCHQAATHSVQVEGAVDGKVYQLTVDTASERTFVRPDMTSTRSRPVAPQQLCGVTGHCTTLRGPVEASILVGPVEQELPVYVADIDLCLLGLESHACLDWRDVHGGPGEGGAADEGERQHPGGSCQDYLCVTEDGDLDELQTES